MIARIVTWAVEKRWLVLLLTAKGFLRDPQQITVVLLQPFFFPFLLFLLHFELSLHTRD